MNEKTVLITGATDGIGKITAEKLADAGVKLLIHGRNPQKIISVVDELKAKTSNQNIEGYQADLSSLTQIDAKCSKVIEKHPSIDVLINNAGLGPGTEETQNTVLKSEDGYELIFQVNYLAIVRFINNLLPALKSSKGRIVNVASAAQIPINFDNVM